MSKDIKGLLNYLDCSVYLGKIKDFIQPQKKRYKIECTKLSKDGTSDWCLLEATQESLREHMKLLKKCYKKIERLEKDNELLKTAVDIDIENKDLKEINEGLDQENKSYIEYIENQDKENKQMKADLTKIQKNLCLAVTGSGLSKLEKALSHDLVRQSFKIASEYKEGR